MSTAKNPEDKDDMSEDGMEFEKFFDGLRSNLPYIFFGSRHGRLLQKRMKVEAKLSRGDQRACLMNRMAKRRFSTVKYESGAIPRERKKHK
ncbi:hypothetical protein EMPG_11396 [Blastomyces silverae]|uniref:Uncharacterized protein n=1 Tax=Blastomyces silverae TaxID=2060906 RepID=A0A0H1BRE9_9EURO|nr:hypothetical protein EMPG_11396 [Blastomyces silverae]